MTSAVGMVATVAATGLALVVGTAPVLRRLPEPPSRPGGQHCVAVPEHKIRYAAMATPRFVAACALIGSLTATVMVLTVPPALWPLWSVLDTVVVLLAAIDARSTWLPLTLTRWAWGLMAVAVGGTALVTGDARLVLRAAVGAAGAGALFWLVWRVTRGGFGFGDVRFIPLLGAATAAHSWTLLLWALVFGTWVGGVQGVMRLVTRRRGHFAYAPALLSGCYLAAVGLALIPP